jgi:translation initiation factor 2B subunit (eIF-2B alpha/beta/delta family)
MITTIQITDYVLTISMSDSSERELDQAQKKQNKIGAAESDPKTTGSAENLREEAAETIGLVDEEEEAAEPV